MKMRIAGLVDDSIVDGPGLRLAVFAQGCPHGCPGCHNPESHDPAAGKETDSDDVLRLLDENPLLDGVTLTGGDPFLQPAPCAEIARGARERGLSVWTYSGWTFEQILSRAQTDPQTLRLLRASDVLVDGPFLMAERSLDVPWRGSRNQRLIDVPASLARGRAVCLPE